MNKPSTENISKWLEESLEGNLTPQEEQMLEDFLVQNPSYLEDDSIWGETKLEPSDEEERYPREKSLLKRALWERPIFYISTAAATLVGAAIWVFGSLGSHKEVKQSVSEPTTQVAEKSNSNSSEEKGSTTEISALPKSETKMESVPSDSKSPNNEIEKPNRKEGDKGSLKTKIENTAAGRVNTISEGPTTKSSTSAELAEVPVSVSNPINASESAQKVELEQQTKAQSNRSKLEESTPVASTESVRTENEILVPAENPIVRDWLSEEKAIDRLTRNPVAILLNERAEAEKRVAYSVEKPNQTRISSNYDKSFASSMKSFVRKVERMMDNPLALYNSKDQYFHAPGMQTLAANFAAVGDQMGPRIMTLSRAQYYGTTSQQYNNTASFDTYVRSLRGGIGVVLDHTYYGTGQINVGQVALTYSPKIGINKNWVLEPALRLKVGNMSLDHAKLQQGDLLELQRGTIRTFDINPDKSTFNGLWYKDVGLGMMTNSKWFFAGVQVDNLGKHFNNIYTLSESGANARAGLHFIANAGTDYVSKNKNISLSPYVIYQKMEKLSEIWGGAIFRYKKLTLGGAYSSGGGYAGSIGLKTNSFMLTYNADVTTSALVNKQVLSHQVILRILINNGSNGQRMLKQL